MDGRSGSAVLIRPAVADDGDAIWAIFAEVVSAGDTYPYSPDITRSEALRLWMVEPQATYVAVEKGEVLGTYYIRANQPDLGAHVCNAGYMVAGRARRKGFGRAMGEHSLEEARRLGYRAMQFNLVVATNEASLHLWRRLGFETVGILPKAFKHVELGFVDALVMYRLL